MPMVPDEFFDALAAYQRNADFDKEQDLFKLALKAQIDLENYRITAEAAERAKAYDKETEALVCGFLSGSCITFLITYHYFVGLF